jgi:hypothetical protein
MPFSLDFQDALDRCRTVDLTGHRVRTLAVPDLLIVLCVQLAKDTAEPLGGPRLIKVCDIAELVRSHPGLDWNSVVRESRRLGVLHLVCLGLAVAARLLGSAIPPAVQESCRGIRSLDSLILHVEERVLGDGTRPYSHPEFLDCASWNAAIRERFRDREKGMITLTYFALSPNGDDYAFVRLPRKLAPLYRLVRPVRLAWKYGRLGVGKLVGRPFVP